MSAALGLYRSLAGLLEPLAPALLKRRVGEGKEDADRWAEKLGRASAPRPDGPLVWLHGVSVGESLSLLPLLERLRAARPDAAFLVTSGTVTSAEILSKRLPEGVIHQYAPLDAPRAIDRFLAHWRPDLAVLVESELWPNLIRAARRAGVKLALVSARITERTARGWSRLPGAAKEVLGAFDLVLPQDDESAERLAKLGRASDGRLNLKYAGDPLPYDRARLGLLRDEAADRPMILAASTHPGEDEIVLEAFQWLGGRIGDHPILVIVPRHPDRGAHIETLSKTLGYDTARQGAGDAFSHDCDVYVADTLGELGLWFRLARVAFLGGSLKKGIGGHNPIEATLLGAPVVSGPYVDNWAGVYGDLVHEGMARFAPDGDQISHVWDRLLDRAPSRTDLQTRTAALLMGRARELNEAVARLAALLP